MDEGRKRVIGIMVRFSQAFTCGLLMICSEAHREAHGRTN
jgi:hypothetical protein